MRPNDCLSNLYFWCTWNPMLYIYSDGNKEFWKRLQSKRFCVKIMPIFVVSTLDELIEKIRKCKHDRNFMYSRGWSSAKGIMEYISFDEIAKTP